MCVYYSKNIKDNGCLSSADTGDINVLQSNRDINKCNSFQCEYCFKSVTKPNSNRHNKTCKGRTDAIRLLEIELKKTPFIPEKLQCRFCKRYSTHISNLNKHVKVCKVKQKYYLELLEEDHTATIEAFLSRIQ